MNEEVAAQLLPALMESSELKRWIEGIVQHRVAEASKEQARAVLRSDEIERLIEEQGLIEEHDPTRIQPASYDIRLGTQYYQQGEIKSLEPDQWIEIGPRDLAFVSSYEAFKVPEDLVGRYSLRLGLLYQGVVLLGGGAPIDPGYRGKIFGLLINFSSEPVRLRYKDHWATVEFSPTTVTPRSKRYTGKYQEADLLAALPPQLTITSGMLQLQRDFEAREQELRARIGEHRQEIACALKDFEDGYRRAMETLERRVRAFTLVVVAGLLLLSSVLAIIVALK